MATLTNAGPHHPKVGVILTCIALLFRRKAIKERSSSLLIQEVRDLQLLNYVHENFKKMYLGHGDIVFLYLVQKIVIDTN